MKFFTGLLVAICAIGRSSDANAGAAPENILGLPSQPLVDDAGAKNLAALGQRIFLDRRLSRDGSISCASCHVPERAFSDGRRVAQGIGGQVGTRNTPSLLNVAYNTSEFWDGRRPSLEAQALDPLSNPLEHGLRDENELMDRIRSDPTYAAEFRAAFSIDTVHRDA